MGGSVNLRSIIQQYVFPGDGGGVSALNDLTSSIDLISSDGSLIIDKTGGTGFDSSGNAIDASGNRVLNLRVADASGNGVASVNDLSGSIDFISADGTIGIDASGNNISLIVNQSALQGRVESLNELTGVVNIVSPSQDILVAVRGQDVELDIPAVKQATYYKSAPQNMINGGNGTDVSFDLSGAWNNDGGYITHTDGTTDFTVVQPGLYHLEFNAQIASNGATWGTGSNKTINIEITRSPNGERAITQQACLTASNNPYGQSVSATYRLNAGDIINLRLFNSHGTANIPTILGVQDTFDLNTFFSWRIITVLS
jgi:hypothetical protein